jgi:hypothetical protein
MDVTREGRETGGTEEWKRDGGEPRGGFFPLAIYFSARENKLFPSKGNGFSRIGILVIGIHNYMEEGCTESPPIGHGVIHSS